LKELARNKRGKKGRDVSLSHELKKKSNRKNIEIRDSRGPYFDNRTCGEKAAEKRILGKKFKRGWSTTANF